MAKKSPAAAAAAAPSAAAAPDAGHTPAAAADAAAPAAEPTTTQTNEVKQAEETAAPETAVAAPAEEASRATVRRATQPPSASVPGAADEAAEAAAADLLAPPPVLFLSIETPSGKTVKVETTPADCVLDVRQFLLDCPESAEYTCYHLESSFGILNDYLELAEYPQLQTGPGHVNTLKIVPELYDERASRMHVRRFRELLVKPPANIQPSAVQAGYGEEEQSSQEQAVATKEGGKKKKGKKGKKQEDDPFAEFAPTSAPAANAAANALPTTFSDAFSLHSFHPSTRSAATDVSLVDSVRQLSFSGFNPPPGNRSLQGDLLYLEITTAEGTQVHVTANQEGFFVNQSSGLRFNPERAEPAYKSLTLVELLRKISPSFHSKWSKACQRKISQHPFEGMELPAGNHLSHHWLAQAKPHTYDWNRSEDSLMNTFGAGDRGVARDWNEEYQSCRELPKSTPAERVLRDRTMYRIYSDFVEAATKGAVAVVHGHIPPVNPMDAPRSYVFIYNNIFFSFAVDARELDDHVATPAAAGGDPSADIKITYQMANQDLHGVKAYTDLDIDELHTLATVLVDYRGHRVICQSIIPGIFSGERASSHVYGSMNHGETIVESKPEFHQLMVAAAEKLHIKTHPVLDGEGKAHELATCVESKGIVGSDGRNYILDLLRVFPRDANFVAEKTAAAKDASTADSDEKEEKKAEESASSPSQANLNSFLLRPELVRFFCRTKAFESLFPSTPEAKEKKEKEDAERKEKRKQRLEQKRQERKAAGETVDESEEALAEEEAEAEREEMDEMYASALRSQKFNPDALTDVRLGSTHEEIAEDESNLKLLSKYLKEDLLQKLVTGLRNLEMSPVDSQHLTQLLHENGINMRYLSSIIALAQSLHLPHIESLCIQECIVRSAKHIFNAFLRNITPEKSRSTLANKNYINSIENLYFAPLIAKFLNSLFGVNAMGHKITQEQIEAAETIVKAQREEDKRERREANKAIAAAQAAAAGLPTGEEEEQEEESSAESKPSKKSGKKKNKADSAPAKVRDMVLRLADGSRAPTDPLSPANLWTLIRFTVKEKFQYELPAYLPMPARSKLCLLRSFCLKTGVQLQCKDYDLSPTAKNTVPFTVPDVLDLFPVVKAHLPGSADARELLDSGRAYLMQGQFLPAYQLLSESLNLHHQVFGPMHVDSANVYSTLALTCYHAGETGQAIDFQQRAVIIYERVLGLDHFETAHSHMHLSLFLHSAGQVKAALKHIQRALFLFELISGPNHPDTAAAHINAAMIMQESGALEAGLKHVETALERNQLALGPDHIQVALSHHTVAVASALLGNFRTAVNHEKMAKSIYLAQWGNKHPSAVRSHYWLEQFTSLAVRSQQTQNRQAEGKGGKKAAAAAAAAIQAAMRTISPASIIPPQMAGLHSPLTWVSLHTSTAVKGKLSMVDVLQLLDNTARAEQSKQAAAQQQQLEKEKEEADKDEAPKDEASPPAAETASA